MKSLQGTVVSTKMKNTVVVEVARQLTHPLYKKIMHRTKKYKVDYRGDLFKKGDSVEIVEIRPLSKDKHYKVVEGQAKT